MSNTVTKRMRKGIARRNQMIKRAAKKLHAAETAPKAEGRNKK
jgi:hypothetical protein